MKKLYLLCLLMLSAFAVSAETWTPVGTVQWTEGALTVQNSSYNKTWSVPVERSDSRPQVFRLQPYASIPISQIVGSSYYKTDNVYVYLHAENPQQVYMEYYRYYYYYNSTYGRSYYYHVWQRCPENGFDSRYYGEITNNTTIQFPAGAFAVDDLTTSAAKSAPSSSAKYSTYVHKIVFPEGLLDYTPESETWVNIGKGEWEDPFWTKDGNPTIKTVEFERNVQNPVVYRTKPFTDSEYVKINTKNPSEVFITPYSHVNSAGNTMVVTQRCTENGVNASYYGTIKDGVITIPGDYFRYNQQGSTSYTNCSSDRKCVITLPEGYNDSTIGENSGIFMGIISFNDKIDNMPITLLNSETEPAFIDFVDNMEMENATLLYYAVDQAITTIEKPYYPDNLTNAMIITFTDGLDQGSLAMKPEHLTSRNYAQYLSDRIASTTVKGLPLQAYTIGLKSSDVGDDELFMLNLQSLSSDSTNAHSVSDIDAVQEELTKLYEDLYRQTSKRVVSVAVPMMSHGDKYRFTLDGTVDPDKVDDSELWLEGVFDITDFSLNEISYHGFSSTSGEKIEAERDGVYIKFSFTDCRDENGEILEIEKNDIDQWTYISSSNTWQHNVENDKDGKIDIEDIRTSAAIMFVLDCSRSLGDLFPLLKQTANTFIDRLAGGNGDYSGIEEVKIGTTDIDSDAPVEYYTIQGIRVITPEKGFYIRRQGKSVSKILIK